MRTCQPHAPRALIATLLAAGALSASPALAQQSGGLRPVDPNKQPIQDLGGWLGEGDAPKARTSQDPLAPAPEQPQTAAQRAAAAKRENEIERNYDAAQKIYQEVLNSDPVGPVERRIKNNQKIVQEFSARIAQADAEHRQLQVNLYNRSFYLKQQREQGQLSEDAYSQLITQEQQKYEQRNAQLQENLKSWGEEVKAATARIRDLEAKRRLLLAEHPRPTVRRSGVSGMGGAHPQAPGAALLGTLQARLAKLSRFDAKDPMDGVNPRDLVASPPPRPALGRLGPDPLAGPQTLGATRPEPTPDAYTPIVPEPSSGGD